MKKQIIALLLLVFGNFCVAQQQKIGLPPASYFLNGCGCSGGSLTVKNTSGTADFSQVQWFKDGQLLTTTTASLTMLSGINSSITSTLGGNPGAMTIDANGNIYVEGGGGNGNPSQILMYTRNATTPTVVGIIPLVGSGLGPQNLRGNALAVDKKGGIYAVLGAFQNPKFVSYFAPGQTTGVTLNIPNLADILAITLDAAGRLYVLANTSTSSKTSILRLTGLPNMGGIAANKFTIETFLSNAASGYPTNTLGPEGNFKVDALGNMYVLFYTNAGNIHDVIKVTPNNVVTKVVANIAVVAGSVSDSTVGINLVANNMAIDGCGNIYLGDQNRIQKFTQGSNHAVTVLDNIHPLLNGDNVAFLNILNDSFYFLDNSGNNGTQRLLNYAQANTFTPTQAGVYTAKVINALGNSTSATGSVTVAAAEPIPSVTLQGNNTAIVYTGTAVTFTATPTNAGATVTYTFYVNNNPVSSGTSNTFTYTPNNQDSVTCLMTSTTSCGATVVQSNTIKLKVSSSQVSLSGCGCINSSIVVIPNGFTSNVTQTQWFKDGQLFKTVTPNANTVITLSSALQQNGYGGINAMDNIGNIYTLHNCCGNQGYILKYDKIGSGFPNAPNIVVGSNTAQLAAFGGNQVGLEVDNKGGCYVAFTSIGSAGISYFKFNQPQTAIPITITTLHGNNISWIKLSSSGKLYVSADKDTINPSGFATLASGIFILTPAPGKSVFEGGFTTSFVQNSSGTNWHFFDVDQFGNIYVPQTSTNQVSVVKIDPSGNFTTIHSLFSANFGQTSSDSVINFNFTSFSVDKCGNALFGDVEGNIKLFKPNNIHGIRIASRLNTIVNIIDVRNILTNNDTLYVFDQGIQSIKQIANCFSLTPTQAGVYTAIVTDDVGNSFTSTNSATIATAEPIPSVSLQGDNVIPGGFVGSGTLNAPVCAGSPVVFTATPTNAGAVKYTFYVNSANPVNNGSNNVFTLTNPQNQDSVTCVMTSTTNCGAIVVQSNTIKLTVVPVTATSVNIKANATTICQNQTVKFDTTNTITNGASIFEIDYSVLSSGVTTTFNNGQKSSRSISNLKDGDVVTATIYFINSNTSCFPTAVSNSITISVVSSVTPTVNFQPLSTFYCSGKPIDFAVDATNAGTSPTFEFRKNNSTGIVLGTSANPSLSGVTGLVNGDKVFCKMTSNSTCQSTNNATATTAALVILNTQTASVELDDPTGGANQSSVQLCSNTNTLVNLNGIAIGKPSVFGLANLFQVAVFDASGNVIVSSHIVYEWRMFRLIHTSPNQYVSNLVVSRSSQYQPTNTFPVVDGDSLVCTVNLIDMGCFTNTLFVRGIKVNITAPVTSNLALSVVSGTLSSAPTANTAADTSKVPNYCSLTIPTFTANLTNTSVSVLRYDWSIYRGGSLSSITSTQTNTFTPITNTTVQNGDVIQCKVVTSTACAPSIIASNNVKMDITKATSPTVSIAPSGIVNGAVLSPMTVCSDSIITFIAIQSPIVGYTPTYEWFINGIFKGTGSSFQSTNFTNGDVVTCKMTTTSITGCIVNGTYSSSNSIKVNVITPLSIGSLQLLTTPNPVCFGSAVTINASRQITIGGTTATLGSIPGETYTFSYKAQVLPNIYSTQVLQTGSSSVLKFKPTVVGTVICSYKASSCSWGIAVKSLDITFSPLPVMNPIIVANPGQVCKGDSIFVTDITSPNSGEWTSLNNSGTVKKISNISALVYGINAGTSAIQYKATTADGCSDSVKVSIPVKALPAVPSIAYSAGTINPQYGSGGSFCAGKIFTLVGTPSGGIWRGEGAGITSVDSTTGVVTLASSVSGVTFPAAAKVIYKITINGCSNTKIMTGTVTVCSHRGVANSNEPMSSDYDFTIYPNPANSSFNLNVKTLVGSGSIVVTDLFGKQVKQQVLSMGSNTVNISNLSKGFYLVSIITSEVKTTKKLIVE